MSFKKSQEFKKIVDLLKVEGVYEEIVFFQCYSDNIFTFHVKDAEKTHEFNLICEDILFREMLVTELLSVDRLKYFEYSVFEDKYRDEVSVSSHSHVWSINKQ